MLPGKIVLSLAPGNDFSRHSEGDFIRLRDGRILFIYSRFTESFQDAAPSDLVALTSCDEGETWSDPRVVLPASLHGEKNVMSVSLLRMQNGDIGLFYIVKRPGCRNDIMLSRSSDEGESFTRHISCTAPERSAYYVLNNCRVERLHSGRLLMPLAFHRSGADASRADYIDMVAFTCFLYSDDDGESWHESPAHVMPPFTRTATGLQEPGVVQLHNGAVWGYSRTDAMYQYEYFSMDGGLSWTPAAPSRFTSPPSPMKLVHHPHTGDLYAIWNPIPNYNTRVESPAGWGRTPLVCAVSHDDGATWADPVVIEDDPQHGYCYPAPFFTNDGCMLLSYCAGGPDDGICLARLTIRKFPLA